MDLPAPPGGRNISVLQSKLVYLRISSLPINRTPQCESQKAQIGRHTPSDSCIRRDAEPGIRRRDRKRYRVLAWSGLTDTWISSFKEFSYARSLSLCSCFITLQEYTVQLHGRRPFSKFLRACGRSFSFRSSHFAPSPPSHFTQPNAAIHLFRPCKTCLHQPRQCASHHYPFCDGCFII